MGQQEETSPDVRRGHVQGLRNPWDRPARRELGLTPLAHGPWLEGRQGLDEIAPSRRTAKTTEGLRVATPASGGPPTPSRENRKVTAWTDPPRPRSSKARSSSRTDASRGITQTPRQPSASAANTAVSHPPALRRWRSSTRNSTSWPSGATARTSANANRCRPVVFGTRVLGHGLAAPEPLRRRRSTRRCRTEVLFANLANLRT